MTLDRVEYICSQDLGDRFPQIDRARFESSVVFVDAKPYEGAQAVFRTLAYAPKMRWALSLYRSLPGFAWITEAIYRLVANNRSVFSLMTNWFWGDSSDPSSYYQARKIFLIFLGLVYLVAFASLWGQIQGLVGSTGILPAKEFLEQIQSLTGSGQFWRAPTVFWFYISDGFLVFVCLAGLGLSLLAIFGIFQAPVFFLLWLLYLSLLTVGQDFMAFQWDILLLEAGFLAIFFAPFSGRGKSSSSSPVSGVVLFLYRFLLFRVMFSSGLGKLVSGDPLWRGMEALNYHYETQPLPTWGGWYAHQLPHWFQEISVAGVFFIQLLIPFLIFAPRRIRMWTCMVIVVFQSLIWITGNYGFFNLLTLALCILLLDDAYLRKMLPEKLFSQKSPGSDQRQTTKVKQLAVDLLAVIVISIATLQYLTPMLIKNFKPPEFISDFNRLIRPFHLVNPYGLFAVMTANRNEIVIEGSDDGQTWKAYEFKWKPGDVKRAPEFLAPYQPRLDWQMWFAALSDYRYHRWFQKFLLRLMENSPSVSRLLRENPFPDKPPQYLRAVLYRYHFSDFSAWQNDKSWWQRERLGLYTPVMKLKPSKEF